jgi:hypothetical protein
MMIEICGQLNRESHFPARPGPLRYNGWKRLPRREVEFPVRQAFGASC